VAILFICLNSIGCNLFPDVRREPRYHNPFPQIETVAILPFRNQSEEPTINMERVTLGYYEAIQSLPGFEVLPVGIVSNHLAVYEQQILQRPISNTEDIQRFATYLGVDAVLQGSVTDFDSYYPPRMTMKVNWYAANPGFHPIPAGYGLPWGTKAEKKIPQNIRLEAERALAREQIATQTPASEPVQNLTSKPNDSLKPDRNSPAPYESPDELEQPEPIPSPSMPGPKTAIRNRKSSHPPKPVVQAAFTETDSEREAVNAKRIELPGEFSGNVDQQPLTIDSGSEFEPMVMNDVENGPMDFQDLPNDQIQELPPRWPDPQGFIPAPPKSSRPVASPQSEPIISHMRSYNGSDSDFTQALSDYYYFRDDGRFGGWEAYLQRSEDFIRFCCHQHVVETLAARGGELKSRTVVRWPLDRYER